MSLQDYITLGRSGLRVDRLSLGTMTFGTEWGWGSDEAQAREIFDRYVDQGGNTVDTANLYTNGKSEQMVGKFIGEKKLRDRIVLATKFTFNTEPGNPDCGRQQPKEYLSGAGRIVAQTANGLYRSLLVARLGRGYSNGRGSGDVDGSGAPRQDSLLRILGYAGVVRGARADAGRKRRQGTAGSRCNSSIRWSSATSNGNIFPPLRNWELALCPWSPLGRRGFLTGKYKREGAESGKGEGRLETTERIRQPGSSNKFSERNWRIHRRAGGCGEANQQAPLLQVALNWVITQPGVTSTIIGATKISQLSDNLQAAEFTIPVGLRKRFDEVSAPEAIHPYVFFGPDIQPMVTGGTSVRK